MTSNAQHVPLFIADDLIMIAAFRYALGRQSYIVAHIASWIEQHAGQIRDSDARLIIREIDEQAAAGSLGAEMDKRRWRCVQARLRARLLDAAIVPGIEP